MAGCEKTRIIQAGGTSDGVVSSGAYDNDGNIDLNLTVGGPVTIPGDITYELPFVIADWVIGATDSTISIPVATHLKGVNPTVTAKEGTLIVSLQTDITPAGDVTLTVPNGSAFDGEVTITR
jgi:hypothetical protein